MAPPAIILAPGSFRPAEEYNPLIKLLNKAGYRVHAHTSPTSRKKPGATASTLAEDAMFIKGQAAALCDLGQDVVVLAHSYGGMSATESVQGLTEKREGKVGWLG